MEIKTVTQPVPPALIDVRDAFVKWVPTARMIRTSAMFRFAFEKPAVPLGMVWPQFVVWMLNDEHYGVRQFLPQDRRLQEIASEVEKWLLQGQGNVKVQTELMEALLPYGQALTDKDHVAAGCAWQVLFGTLEDTPPAVLRYFLAANRLAQPGNAAVALRAAVEQSLRKVLDLLKANSL